MYDESEFDLHLSLLLQLVNAWAIELRDDSEHSYLKKNIIESCCDNKICDHSSLLERYPKFQSESHVEAVHRKKERKKESSEVFVCAKANNSSLAHQLEN